MSNFPFYVSSTAQSNLRKRSKYHDMRLSRREFRQFVELVVDELPGAESFEFFVEFLTNSVEVNLIFKLIKSQTQISFFFFFFFPNVPFLTIVEKSKTQTNNISVVFNPFSSPCPSIAWAHFHPPCPQRVPIPDFRSR